MKNIPTTLPNNLLCFSHLRWDFVFQRPQHLMTRFAKETNVYYWEEPIHDAANEAYLNTNTRQDKVTVITPHLPAGTNSEQEQQQLTNLLNNFLLNTNIDDWMFWYYTPMALTFSEQHKPALIAFDCMDELSAFDFAPKELVIMEKKLMELANVVFTGGHSLYEAKKNKHNNIHPFPSSIDKQHFSSARLALSNPEEQANIRGIKIGFFGVIDERFHIRLIEHIANKRPDWQIILIGPVVKIPAHTLPRNSNIHYLGQKTYHELPCYLSGWDVALIPFELNESTRFISPTKTPEYLAAGVRVVSTPIRDVVKPYGIEKLVGIAEDPDQFIDAIEEQLDATDHIDWLQRVDLFLKDKSWDHTYSGMRKQMLAALSASEELLAS